MVKPFASRASKDRRTELREEHWPGVRAWGSKKEVGYFNAPRTLPLILELIDRKSFSGKDNVGRVYLELFSRHMGEGVIEMTFEQEHAHAAGYQSTRWQRSWRDRMKVLQDLGLISIQQKGGRPYGLVLLHHPTIAVGKLRKAGRVPDDWWESYRQRQIEVKEPSYEKMTGTEETIESAG
jgi:hypothetical protein